MSFKLIMTPATDQMIRALANKPAPPFPVPSSTASWLQRDCRERVNH